MAQKDLIPVTERSKEEAKELSRRGGIASGKARLRKKRGKELVRAILEMKEIDPATIASYEALGIPASELTNEVQMHLKQIQKAIAKEDTAAYNAVLHAAGYDEQKLVVDDQRRIIEVASPEEKKKLTDLAKSDL